MCYYGSCQPYLEEPALKRAGLRNMTHLADGTPLPAEAARRFREKRQKMLAERTAMVARGEASDVRPECYVCLNGLQGLELSADMKVRTCACENRPSGRACSC